MQTLVKTLQDRDLGHLRIVAEAWGLDLPAGPPPEAARALAEAMLAPARVEEVVEALPEAARAALGALAEEGKLPFADLTRRYGELREMGPGRRDREKPWRDSGYPLESLWYRGLLARAFADAPTGPLEYAFVPSDLLLLLPRPPRSEPEDLGAPAEEPAEVRSTLSTCVDDATTLLAALRRRPLSQRQAPTLLEALPPYFFEAASAPLLWTLLRETGVLAGEPAAPDPEAVRQFLDAPRGEAQGRLLQAWASATAWNDLAQVRSLTPAAEGWPNDAHAGRQAALGLLRSVPVGTWWGLEAFVAAVRERHPGFQRPGGEFESWYLRQADSGAFLRGFEHWDEVEGAYLRHLIAGPLFWLGAAELGRAKDGSHPTAFRLTAWFDALFEPPALAPEGEEAKAAIGADGRVRVPPRASRALRYQIARFTDWSGLDGEMYVYRLTPGAVGRALESGLEVGHVRAVLEAISAGPVPPALARALGRWSERGTEARLERVLVLRVASAAVLEELRLHRETARYLGEALGPTAVRIRESDQERLRAAAARTGILLEPANLDPLAPPGDA